MSERSPTGDPLISEAEEAELEAGDASRAANLFDLRRIIGGLFVIYGVILVILGLGASDAEIEKAAGWNLNLWVGRGDAVVAAIFLVWAFARPLGERARGGRATQSDARGRAGSQTTRRRPRRDRGAPAASSAPGAQQRQHRAAEAAADHARAGGAGAP